LFIDESGNHDLRGCDNPYNRYLSLTGIIVEQLSDQRTLDALVAQLKTKHFGHVPISAVLLHREEIINRVPPFDCLLNPAKAALFDSDLCNLLAKLKFVALTAIIDKLEHQRRYPVWIKDPYHYCLEALIERYVMFLDGPQSSGDVMVEARNKKLDKKLKKLFKYFYRNGTQYITAQRIQQRFTSHEIKLKPKSANIAALQICDLLQNPACMAARARQNKAPLPNNFGGKIAAILEASKYRRASNGKIDGWGRKWLP
jgi:hypothetical protein